MFWWTAFQCFTVVWFILALVSAVGTFCWFIAELSFEKFNRVSLILFVVAVHLTVFAGCLMDWATSGLS